MEQIIHISNFAIFSRVQGRTQNQKLRRWIAKQGERDAISSEILKIRHQTASSSKFINDPTNTPLIFPRRDLYTNHSDHQPSSVRTDDLRRLISTQNHSEHRDDVQQNHREHSNHVVSSMNETTGRFQPILRRPRPSFENDGNRPIGTAHRFQIIREVNPSSRQSFDDETAGPSGMYSTDGQLQKAQIASSVRALPIHNSSNDDVYKSIKEIELEEYRRRKQMVNDLAKLCKTIPLTVKMVNPLINNFNGWPNNIIKN